MKVCSAPGCMVQMFGDDEFCQHHEGMKLFDEQHGTKTFPEEKSVNDPFLDQIRRQAEDEIQQEDFREAVEKYKVKLRQRKWWHRLVPFKIILIRRD